MKVLVAEDDHFIREGLKELLEAEGYDCVAAEDGDQAIDYFRSESPDFILLDIMMPNKDGYAVCKIIRQENEQIPIVFVSAKSEEIDQVVGLELGADDYILKPFGKKEIIARIRAISRRCLSTQNAGQQTDNEFKMQHLTVYPDQLRAESDGKIIELSLRDIKILELLHQNKSKVVDRDALFNYCWSRNYLPSSRTLDQHVSKLRQLIEIDPKNPGIIKTVHGVGYRFDG